MSAMIDMTGKRFGSLTVISNAGRINRKIYWWCICDCGTETRVVGEGLRSGNTKSCGCVKLQKLQTNSLKHGLTRTQVHRAWVQMRQRCENENNPNYSDYGARGITVSKRWRTFENFLADMGTPEKGMTLDRRNNDKGYSKRNCRWATRAEQSRNRRPKEQWRKHVK